MNVFNAMNCVNFDFFMGKILKKENLKSSLKLMVLVLMDALSKRTCDSFLLGYIVAYSRYKSVPSHHHFLLPSVNFAVKDAVTL